MWVLKKVFLFVSFVALHKANAYEHSSQALWYDADDECSLDRQSPIELSSYEALETNDIPLLVFHNYQSTYITPAVLTNNGHSADLQIPKSHFASITGGPLHNRMYITESLHFHWGSGNNHGAEHVVDSHRYSMEMHIVHRNAKYPNIAEATQHADGLAVLGVFYNVDTSQDDFAGLNKIVNALDAIRVYNTSTNVNNLNLSELFGNIDTEEFFTYKGSLTTPPCSRAVTWIVFPEPIQISSNQINKFRSLYDSHGDPLVNNYRCLQAKGRRQVYLRRSNEVYAEFELF
ncbi:carbonic anhydrase 2-like [Calliphora vicina]|uniref:carbonic anhydrase 2-like n=1 Tax=Calliphora vicina TaxID=7373 RepID=UPI00325B8E07